MDNIKQVIVVRKDINMRKGKLAAQVAHASMKFLVDNNSADRSDCLKVELNQEEATWLFDGSFTKIVLGCDNEETLRDLLLQADLLDVDAYPIVDSGRTEFHGVPTLTCASFGPANANDVDKVTGHLKPL